MVGGSNDGACTGPQRRMLVAGLAAALALAATGCGGAGTKVATVTAVETTLAPLTPSATPEFLQSSGARTNQVGSGRFVLVFTYRDVPQVGSAKLTAAGAFDAVDHRSLFSVDFTPLLQAAALRESGSASGLSRLDGSGEFEMVTDGSRVYLRFALLRLLEPHLTKPWFSAGAADLGVDRTKLMTQLGGGAASLDRSSLLDFLQGAGTGVHQVGTEAVMGVATTHYAATLSVASLLAKLAPDRAATLTAQLSQLGASDPGRLTIPFDVWVDGTGLVHRMVMTFTGIVAAAPSASVGVDLTLYDLGQSVTIELPPSSDVQSFGDLRSLLKG